MCTNSKNKKRKVIEPTLSCAIYICTELPRKDDVHELRNEYAAKADDLAPTTDALVKVVHRQ